MFLIVGLGNPGKEYEGTRHNTGREVFEHFANAERKAQSAEWRERKPLHAEILECNIATKRVLLAKPTTYMNESGPAVAAIAKHLQLTVPTRRSGSRPEGVGTYGLRLLVVHDDLDLPVGALRLSPGSSSGGHKGVQSIIDALGTSEFLRLRIGIGPNTTPDGHRIPSEKFVLEKFRNEERPLMDAAVQRAVEVIGVLLRDGIAAAQQVANHNS